MIKPVGKGLISIIFSRINRVPHFLIRCKQEIGIYDGLSLGPSIQTSFGSLDNDDIFVLDLMKNSKLHFSIIQSEEGGRFYQEQNRNELYEVGFFDMDLSSSFQWMTLSQIHEMIKFSGNVNIELRTILSILPSEL
jgi:oxidase EvaA